MEHYKLKKYYKLSSVGYNEEKQEATIYVSVDGKTLMSVMTISEWDCTKDMFGDEVEERLAEIGWYPEEDTPSEEKQEETITVNKNKLYVMLTAAVYSGYMEAKGKGFFEDFGADAFVHLDDYIDYGGNYPISKDKNGFFDTELMRDDALEWAKEYAKKF